MTQFIIILRVASSIISIAELQITSERSLMYSKKSFGPKMEHWGTGALTGYSCTSMRQKRPKYVAVLFRWTFFHSDKSYFRNGKRLRPCWWAGKQEISHVVSEIEKELRNISHSQKKETKFTMHWIKIKLTSNQRIW